MDKKNVLKGILKGFKVGALVLLSIVGLIYISIVIYNYSYNQSVKQRRMIPYPTRNKIMTELLQIIMEASNDSNVKPFMLYGTLLGYVRQNDFICYDFDIDMGIMEAEYDKLHNQLKQNIKNYSDYYIKEKKLFGYRCVVVVHTETNINADISGFIIKNNQISRNVPKLYSRYILKESQVDYPIDWILPVKSIQFKTIDSFIPNQPEQLLQTYYGKNFLTPDHQCNATCEECVKIN